jgi:hypothetical protein
MLKVFESFSKEKEIKDWLDENGVENYTLTPALEIDVDGDINLEDAGDLPDYIQFNEVKGDFTMYSMELLELKGYPKIVGGYFNISDSKELRSLKYSPFGVGGHYDMSGCFSVCEFDGISQDIGDDIKAYGSGIMTLGGLGKYKNLQLYLSQEEKANMWWLDDADEDDIGACPIVELLGVELIRDLILPNLSEFVDNEVIYTNNRFYFNPYAFLSFIKDHAPNKLANYKKDLPTMVERAKELGYLID